MFYECAEKKVELIVKSNSKSLRSFGFNYWNNLVNKCNAKILSQISSKDIDAYLLSESSLFVWDNKFLIITCGQTVLINSLIQFISDHGHDSIESIIFQRENEIMANTQKTTFEKDVEILSDFISGDIFKINSINNESCKFFTTSTFNENSKLSVSNELQLSGISEINSRPFFSKNQNSLVLRKLLGVNKFLGDFVIDDHIFEPCGYSLNALLGNKYVTIHVTPQKDNTFISLKTNIEDQQKIGELEEYLILTFNPSSIKRTSINNPLTILDRSHYHNSKIIKKSLPNGDILEQNFSNNLEIKKDY